MARYLPDGTTLGVVYEESEGWFRYECEHCCYACSGSDQYRLELRADNHERDCNQRTV
jgi:hypothetical protein